ncbi:serine hydrolase FSH [Xylariaceae sp. FL1651]|nr:serine hydrolase FSH [Xylariaceae sp. FL1651]
MRFLCLHGRGTNAEFFKHQMSNVCEALGDGHEFIFVDGSVPTTTPPPEGIIIRDAKVGGKRLGFWPLDDTNIAGYRAVCYELSKFIDSQGPFDGFVGFCEGASVASTILAYDTEWQNGIVGVKCAIFFAGLPPLNLLTARRCSLALDGILVRVPTVHIWDKDGDPDVGQELANVCIEADREVVNHHLGHGVPGLRSDPDWRKMIHAIERTIERAKDYE